MRLSIELSPEQHEPLKAAAAMQGKSIKDYVLDRTLPSNDGQEVLRNLVTFLKPRIAATPATNTAHLTAPTCAHSLYA